MPTKTSTKATRGRRDYKALVDELRQVIRDEERGFVIKCNKNSGFPYPKKGDTDVLTRELAYEIIADLVRGKESLLTRDYRATKAKSVRGAKPRTLAPA